MGLRGGGREHEGEERQGAGHHGALRATAALRPGAVAVGVAEQPPRLGGAGPIELRVQGERPLEERRALAPGPERHPDRAGVEEEPSVGGAEAERSPRGAIRLLEAAGAEEREGVGILGVHVAAARALRLREPDRLAGVSARRGEKERERAAVGAPPVADDAPVRLARPRGVPARRPRVAEEPRGLRERRAGVRPLEEAARGGGVAARERDAPAGGERGGVLRRLREGALELRVRPGEIAAVPGDERRLRAHPGARLGIAARVHREAGRLERALHVALEPEQVRGAGVGGEVRLQVHHRLGRSRCLLEAAELEQRVGEEPVRGGVARRAGDELRDEPRAPPRSGGPRGGRARAAGSARGAPGRSPSAARAASSTPW